MLANALRGRNALPEYDTILDDLYKRSNVVHNPGSAYEKKSHPLQMKEVTYLMRHPAAAGEAAKELSQQITAPLVGAGRQTGPVLQRAASFLDLDLPLSARPSEIGFPALLRIMEDAKKRIEEVTSNLTQEEKDLLDKNAINPMDGDRWNEVLAISMKVDRSKLFQAFSPLLSFLTRDNLSLLKKDLSGGLETMQDSILYEAVTPMGKVIVGGAGAKCVYRGRGPHSRSWRRRPVPEQCGWNPSWDAGGAGNRGGRERPLPEQREYFAGCGRPGRRLSHGSRRERYGHFIGRKLGSGFWGVGFLYHGDGDGVFQARRFSQGMGQMGIGLLMNRNGDDRYLCSYGGQGLGLFGGEGILIDEAGNDFYQLGDLELDFCAPAKATQSFGQGSGWG